MEEAESGRDAPADGDANEESGEQEAEVREVIGGLERTMRLRQPQASRRLKRRRRMVGQ